MNSYAEPSKGAITYEQWLLNRIAEPGTPTGRVAQTARMRPQHEPEPEAGL